MAKTVNQDWMLSDEHVIALLQSGVTRAAIGRSATFASQGEITVVYFLRPSGTPGKWIEVAHLSQIVKEVLWYERSWGTGEQMENYQICDWELVRQRWQEGTIYESPIEGALTHACVVNRVV